MKVLITGSNGFVGHNIVKYILKNTEWEITCMVRNKKSKIEDLNVKILIHDLKNEFMYDENYDIIIHCAALISYTDIDDCICNNIIATSNILKFANDHCKLFIYMSSVAVYGDAGTFTENDTPLPNNIYGISKLTGEYFCRMYKDKLNILILRINNIWGPEPDKSRFQYLVEYKFKTETCPHFKLYTPCRKNWLHINDLCTKILKIINHYINKKFDIDIFNLCGDENITLVEFIRKFGDNFTYEYTITDDIREKLDVNLDESKFKEIFS